MILTITDANIFIDLGELNLIELFFELDLIVHTTAEVLLECDPEHQLLLTSYQEQRLLTIHILDESKVVEIDKLTFNKGLSEEDKGILYIAYKEQAMVLTGDQLIRKWCIRNDLEVHGILWILDVFVQKELLTYQKAIQKLETLMTINQWLPIDLCKVFIEKWKASSNSK